jgi:hypothetical protein
MDILTNYKPTNYTIKPSVMFYNNPLPLFTYQELLQKGLATDSKDSTGKYLIVIKASKVENIIKYVLTNQLSHKFVLAPEGYYWKYFTERCYYRFEWYSLEPIPI